LDGRVVLIIQTGVDVPHDGLGRFFVFYLLNLLERRAATMHRAPSLAFLEDCRSDLRILQKCAQQSFIAFFGVLHAVADVEAAPL
jgi:hypothetical protein